MKRKGFKPMKYTVGWLLRTVGLELGHYPFTAAELAEYTTKHPGHFPEPWDVEMSQYAIDHPDQLLNQEEEES